MKWRDIGKLVGRELGLTLGRIILAVLVGLEVIEHAPEVAHIAAVPTALLVGLASKL